MPLNPRATVMFVIGLASASALGQPLSPTADRPRDPLLPSGISNLPVGLTADLASMFKDEAGTDVVHLMGDVRCTLGDDGGYQMRSREAVVWINHRTKDGRKYRHLNIFLWRNAEVREIAGTTTSGPALFVMLDSFGPIATEVDEFSFRSSVDTRVYQNAAAIRNTLIKMGLDAEDQQVSLRVFDPRGATTDQPSTPRPSPAIHFQSRGRFKGPQIYGDNRVITVVGRVFLSRGLSGADDYLEIQADSAVVFLPPEATAVGVEAPEADALGGRAKDRPSGPSDTENQNQPPSQPDRPQRQPDNPLLSAGFGKMEVEGAYLEGDVVMLLGPNTVRASRLYYDFRKDRALILDAAVRTMLADRGIPLYIRAKEIRQLSAKRFSARHALLTTSEFHTPQYHIAAAKVEVIDRTPPGAGGGQSAIRAGDFMIRGATLHLGGIAVAYWPFLRGTVDTSEAAVKGLRIGFSGNFGGELQTKWHLFNVLGLERPAGFDAELRLDYFSDRGPAVGINAEYKRDRYFGLLRSYGMLDNGEDFLGRNRENPPNRSARGRFLTRHRQYLEDGWELSLEVSYISDDSFLEEFFELEFDNDKEQETLLYLKKQRDDWAFTALLQARILDFTTQTERLPDLAHYIIGRRVADQATWFSETRAGIVRFRSADPTFPESLRNGPRINSGSTLRTESRQELTRAIDVGPLRLVPFVVGRAGVWDDSPRRGGTTRGLGSIGVRGSMYLSRTYPQMKSTLFDIDGLRHVIKSDVTAWITESTRDANDLFPFDERVEGIDSADGAAFGVRQRWQTKRGSGVNRRTVDMVTLDTELGVFNGVESDVRTNGYTSFSRPESSITKNYFNSSLIWRVNDRTALLNELNYDINDSEVDLLNIALAVERTPRFSYLMGYRFIEESSSNLMNFDMNYRLSEKHTLALRESFDLDAGRTLDSTVVLIRKFPRWYTAISFALDEAEDDFGVSFSIWPEGLTQPEIGSRHFTSLANTTRY